jgi:vacuolar-type H+-ATPase subunit I/STV1
MSENLGQRGDAYLVKLNSESVPAWARGMSWILTGLVGFILALGLNLGDIVNRYMDSQSQIQTATLSQSGQVEVNALAGVIDSNKGLISHVNDLILSVNKLIEENQRLSTVNSSLMFQNTELQTLNTEYSEEIKQLNVEIQDLKTRLELK